MTKKWHPTISTWYRKIARPDCLFDRSESGYCRCVIALSLELFVSWFCLFCFTNLPLCGVSIERWPYAECFFILYSSWFLRRPPKFSQYRPKYIACVNIMHLHVLQNIKTWKDRSLAFYGRWNVQPSLSRWGEMCRTLFPWTTSTSSEDEKQWNPCCRFQRDTAKGKLHILSKAFFCDWKAKCSDLTLITSPKNVTQWCHLD